MQSPECRPGCSAVLAGRSAYDRCFFARDGRWHGYYSADPASKARSASADCSPRGAARRRQGGLSRPPSSRHGEALTRSWGCQAVGASAKRPTKRGRGAVHFASGRPALVLPPIWMLRARRHGRCHRQAFALPVSAARDVTKIVAGSKAGEPEAISFAARRLSSPRAAARHPSDCLRWTHGQRAPCARPHAPAGAAI